MEIDEIDEAIYPAIANLKEGEISAPVKIPRGTLYEYQIIWVRKRTPAHVMSLDRDYHKVEAIALNLKRTKDYQAWLEELRGKIYWQIRL